MKLIRKLGTRKVNGRLESWGLFLCPECLQEVERPLGDGKKAKSCGKHKKLGKKHSWFKHGETHNRLYNIWHGMKQRILNSKNKAYKDYGGRGITICSEWTNDYITFKDWALSNGYADNLVIDRENPDGNYEPSNCRFLTIEESNRNKTNTITMEIANEIRALHKTGEYTQQELAEKYNVPQGNISLIVNNKIWKDE